jgi:hypothetical protein
VSSPPSPEDGTDPFSETSCFLFCRIQDDGKCPEKLHALVSFILIQNSSTEWNDSRKCPLPEVFAYENKWKLRIWNGIMSIQNFVKLLGYIKTEHGKHTRRIQFIIASLSNSALNDSSSWYRVLKLQTYVHYAQYLTSLYFLNSGLQNNSMDFQKMCKPVHSSYDANLFQRPIFSGHRTPTSGMELLRCHVRN